MVSALMVLTFIVGTEIRHPNKYQRVMTVGEVTGGWHEDREGHIEQAGRGEPGLSIFFFFFLPHLKHMEVPGPGIESEPWLCYPSCQLPSDSTYVSPQAK